MLHPGRWVLVLLVSLYAACASPEPPREHHDWEDPAIFARGKEDPHATLFPYGSIDAALTGDRAQSPFFVSLNGTWKFHWVKKPADRPAAFYRDDFDVGAWDDIPVPSN